jgi:hypothetical protein
MDRHVGGHEVEHLGQHGNHAALVALADHHDRVALAGFRHVHALEPERLGNAQARAVQQRQHGGVAGENPRRAIFAGAQLRVGQAHCGRNAERLRQSPGNLGAAHGRERADLALAIALEEAGERARRRQRAHQRAAGDSLAAARRHERPHVAHFDARERGQRRRLAQMLGQEREEPPDVAPVGVDGERRHAPLGAQMGEPAHQLRRHVGRRERKRRLLLLGFAHGSRSPA